MRVWDLPTRLVHWLLVLLVAASWITADLGRLDIHNLSGYLLLTLVLFRIYWGFVGSTTARFRSFLRGPGEVASYARAILRGDEMPAVPGHNPMGGWSTVALLTLLLGVPLLGLFAVDVDGVESGPLSHWVNFEVARNMAQLHERLFDALLVCIGLHLTAIAFYWFWRRDNLVGAFITGWRVLGSSPASPGPQFVPWWRAAVGLIVAGLLVTAVAVGLIS